MEVVCTVRLPVRHVAGTSLLTVRAVDGDLADNGHVTYSLAGTDPDDVIARRLFAVNSTTGEVQLGETAAALDREATAGYRLTVVARDLGVPPLSASATVDVAVWDVNDNAPRVAVSTLTPGDRPHVAEAAGAGTFVALVSVSDADAGDNGATSCRLEPDATPFDLVELQRSAKYKIVTRAPLDRETAPEHRVNVTCRDHGRPPLVTAHPVTVAVADINDNPPYFVRDEYEFSVPENNAVGQTLGRVVAADRDAGDNARLEYVVVVGALASTVNFRVDAETGEVRAAAVLDHEAAPPDGYRFTVEARDRGAPALSAAVNVTVTVGDVNDVAPRFVDRAYTFVTAENQPRGSVVGRVRAVDPERGAFGVVRYSLQSAAAAASFDIDAVTGDITTRRLLDRELFPVHRLVAVASNPNASARLSGSADVTVYVSDVNDHAPVVQLPSVGDAGRFPVYVSSGLRRGRRATRIVAHDADAGDNAQLTFHLRGDDDAFRVDRRTGVVYVQRDLSSITHQTFIYRVTVVDRGVPPRSSSASLTIVVNSSIAVPPPSVDDLRGNGTAGNSTGRRGAASTLLSSANFIAVVAVAGATAVVVIILGSNMNLS